MANPQFFQDAFDQLAVNGCIGDPQGKLAYGYLRVSSAGQAEEGRSGLPRQVLHLHEAASKQGFKISWDLMFADDHTGFEFRDRPQLTVLREEYKRDNRRADAVCIEYLDRLSRNADWHQGFLLEEMKEHEVKVIFWKQFTSRIERAVMGAISQEGMEQALQRMADGNLRKARDYKRVNARVPAYGFLFVDSNGQSGQNARQDTHYAINEDEAGVLRFMFEAIAHHGYTLRGLAKWLDEHYPPPRKSKYWAPSQIKSYIENPVYKGEYVACRWKMVKMKATHQKPYEPEKTYLRKVERPPSEWIIVPVPAIVSAELWEQANRLLPRNKQTASRNAKHNYLLTGLMACAECESGCRGWKKILANEVCAYYRCNSIYGASARKQQSNCSQLSTRAERIENAVWKVVSKVILEPETLLTALEQMYSSGANAQLIQEIDYLGKQIAEVQEEDQRLYRAYIAKA